MKYLKISFSKCPGLCNKLFMLASAIDMAQKDANIMLIEPYFGWEKPVRFSTLYDIYYFNKQTGQIMVDMDKPLNKSDIKCINENILWDYSNKNLKLCRAKNQMDINNMVIRLLKALKPSPILDKIISSYIDINAKTAIHVRTESDWVKYSKTKRHRVLTPVTEIIYCLTNSGKSIQFGDIFFTTGENNKIVGQQFEESGFNCQYYYDHEQEYEINACINFYLSSKAKYFIGNS